MSDYWSVFFFYFYVSAKALVVWCLVLRVFLLPQVPFSMRPGWSQEWDAPQVHDWISWTSQWSGQIIIFHRPGFPWNKGISLTKPPFGVRSCEVAIIWPEWWKSKKIAVQHFLLSGLQLALRKKSRWTCETETLLQMLQYCPSGCSIPTYLSCSVTSKDI